MGAARKEMRRETSPASSRQGRSRPPSHRSKALLLPLPFPFPSPLPSPFPHHHPPSLLPRSSPSISRRISIHGALQYRSSSVACVVRRAARHSTAQHRTASGTDRRARARRAGKDGTERVGHICRVKQGRGGWSLREVVWRRGLLGLSEVWRWCIGGVSISMRGLWCFVLLMVMVMVGLVSFGFGLGFLRWMSVLFSCLG
ncbi:hypothetical protein IWX46DRAFT_136615 [Phyllosticta citricarpa]|uniref:Uncharacterized protein n=1 Tax=Phyllosticta citricarpa TaxID=55181 RepID=A0ABR1MPM8_9PEZI